LLLLTSCQQTCMTYTIAVRCAPDGHLQRVSIPDTVLTKFDLLYDIYHCCAPDGHLQRVTIPDTVLIQFDLLMMSTTLLETCRGLYYKIKELCVKLVIY